MHRGVIAKECEWTRKNAADRPVKWILYPAEETFSKMSMDLLFARGETSSSRQRYPITRNLRAAVIIETRLDVFPLCAVSSLTFPSVVLITSRILRYAIILTSVHPRNIRAWHVRVQYLCVSLCENSRSHSGNLEGAIHHTEAIPNSVPTILERNENVISLARYIAANAFTNATRANRAHPFLLPAQ